MSLNTIPPEIWLKIFHNLPASELCHVLLSCKSFHALAKEEIYQDISLSSPQNIVKFLLHIKKNDDAAQKVVSLRFNHRHLLYVNNAHLGSILQLSKTTLPRLVNLRNLGLYGVPRNYDAYLNSAWFSQILDECTFPHLRMFETDVMLTQDSIDNFLFRHQSTIEVLSLRSDWNAIFSIEPPLRCDRLVMFACRPFLLRRWLPMINVPALRRVVVYVGEECDLNALRENIENLTIGIPEMEIQVYGEIPVGDVWNAVSHHPLVGVLKVVKVDEAFD
ncbi:hypothetical protein VNI00_007279 [Paramarasmius palmivorus]|uniref:F-box domain-containing protein n=1 Tax=Paramarasmius palmivorus TaxID=297713 RepID=A0AAW0D6D0_9AGAR